MIVIVPIQKATGQVTREVDIVSRGFVYIKESGRLLDEAKQVVNSAHHQAIGEVAIKLRVSARSNGGVIEAIEHSDRFLFGVQWHPEMLLNDKLTKNLFTQFIAEGRKKHA